MRLTVWESFRSQPPLRAIVRLKDLRLKVVSSSSQMETLSNDNAVFA